MAYATGLRMRLQLLLLATVLLVLLVVGTALTLLLQRYHANLADRRLAEAFEVVNSTLVRQEEALGQQARALAAIDAIVSPVNMVVQYATPDSYDPLIFDAEKQRIADALRRQASLDATDQLAVYDSAGRLMAFHQDGPEAVSGLVSYEQGQPVHYLRRLDDAPGWQRGELPAGVALQAPTLQGVAYERIQDRLALVAAEPVRRTYPNGDVEDIGHVVLTDYVLSDLVMGVTGSTGGRIGILFGDGSRRGDTGDVALADVRRALAEADGLAKVPHPERFIATRALAMGADVQAYLVVGLPRADLGQELSTTWWVLLAVLFTSALVMLPLGAWGAGRYVLRPIDALVNGVEAMRRGERARVRSAGRHELARLAAAFNDMATTIEERERALQRERDFAASLTQTAPVIVLLLDPDGTVRHVNPYFERLSGYRLEELRGRDWFGTFLPETDQAPTRDLFHQALNERPTRGHVNPIRLRDGTVRQIEWNDERLFDASGQVTGLLAIGLDVTERMRSQEALARSQQELRELNESLEARVEQRTAELGLQSQRNSAILAGTPDGFFSTDVQGRLNSVNAAMCNLLGYSEEEMLQLSIADIEANENPAEVAQHIAKVMELGHDRFDTVQRRKDGTRVNVEVSANRVVLGNGSLLFAFVRDITPRIAAAAALEYSRDEAERAKVEAERANAAKSEFLSRMSHELRTPLNAVIGFSQLLQADPQNPLSETQADNVQEIVAAGEHLLAMVNEVLDLSRIESGHIEVRAEAVDQVELIGSCLRQVQPLAERRGIRTGFEPHACTPVLADAVRLRQVLINLLSNAIKYNRDGGSVTVSCVPLAGERLRIGVSDTGRGIDAAQLPRLFQPFERLESAYEGIEGTGIGLALARKLVESMNGTIGVDSVVGEGSTFWFELPLVSGAPAPQATVPAQPALPAPAQAPDRVHRVLCIEDNPANLRLMRKMLGKRADLGLLEAGSAEEGLLIAAQAVPDLVLLDINLPGINGLEALARLRADPATAAIPVVAVTANAMPRDIERGKAAGFADYLTKPLEIAALFRAIDGCLARRSHSGASTTEAAPQGTAGEDVH